MTAAKSLVQYPVWYTRSHSDIIMESIKGAVLWRIHDYVELSYEGWVALKFANIELALEEDFTDMRNVRGTEPAVESRRFEQVRITFRLEVYQVRDVRRC